MNNSNDPRRPDKVVRYSNPLLQQQNVQAQPAGGQANPSGDDLTPDYMNVLGMIFSMCALMMRMKWCAWIALYCSCISFANTKVSNLYNFSLVKSIHLGITVGEKTLYFIIKNLHILLSF